MQSKPEISVVIPTFNRAESLRETLLSLVSQTMDVHQYEVIVVDDGSEDDTAQQVTRFAADYSSFNLRYERHSTNRCRAAACNTGVLVARGELIVFTDDDIRPIPHWIEAHVQRHRRENQNVAVTGLVLYPEAWEHKSNWVRYANENYRKNATIKRLASGSLPPARFAGGNTSLRRETLLRVGLFDEDIRRSEDVSLGCRLFEAGVTLLFEPEALVYHYGKTILSIDATLASFRRSYEFDGPSLRKKFPWFYEKYGHWFLEPTNFGYDTPWRRVAKCFVRIVAHRFLQRVAIRVLKLVDGLPWLYCRMLCQYVQVCEAIDGIRASQKAQDNRRDA